MFHANKDNHDTELSLQALTNFNHKDIDPMSQIVKRWVLELRRAISKGKDEITNVLDVVALHSNAAAREKANAGDMGPFGTCTPAWHQ